MDEWTTAVALRSRRAFLKQFEKIEHQMFHGEAMDIYGAKVESIEKQLGIYQLAQFTPS